MTLLMSLFTFSIFKTFEFKEKMQCIEFAFLKDVEIGRFDLMYRTVLYYLKEICSRSMLNVIQKKQLSQNRESEKICSHPNKGKKRREDGQWWLLIFVVKGFLINVSQNSRQASDVSFFFDVYSIGLDIEVNFSERLNAGLGLSFSYNYTSY